jgi:hypothetical protein
MFSGNKIWRAKHKSFVLLGRFLTDLAPSQAGLFCFQVGNGHGLSSRQIADAFAGQRYVFEPCRPNPAASVRDAANLTPGGTFKIAGRQRKIFPRSGKASVAMQHELYSRMYQEKRR